MNRLCISPDKRFLAAAGRHTVKLYDVKSNSANAVLSFDGHTANITAVAFHCEGKWMVTSSEDGSVKIWDARSGSVQRNYSHGVAVNDVVIHPNQGELISCDRAGHVRIWDLGENKCSHTLIPEDDVSVASVTIASDGSILCAGNNAVRSLSLSSVRSVRADGVEHRNADVSRACVRAHALAGQRVRVAHGAATGDNVAGARVQVRRAPDVHYARAIVARRAPSGHVLRRPQRAHLGRRPGPRPQRNLGGRRPPAAAGRVGAGAVNCRPRPGRAAARDDAARPPALGVGLRLQRRLGLPRHRVLGPLRPPLGAQQPEHHPPV